MKIRKRQLQLFILLFAASSLLFQLPSGAFASSPSEITAADSETDESNGFTMLDGAYGVDTFTIGTSTYAIVTGNIDNGVQIIDISDPTDIVAVDAETDGANGFTALDGAREVEMFTIGDSTYAIVTASDDGGIQIIDISDPENIVATDAVIDAGPTGTLSSARDVATFTIDSSTYAIVAAQAADSVGGVKIFDISDPTNIVAKDYECDDNFSFPDPECGGSFTALGGATGVDTFTIGSSTYAIVVSYTDDGVTIIDISDVDNIVAKDTETDGSNGFTMLDQATGVETFTVGSSTYAIVTSLADDGVQIIDISDVDNIVAVDAETDGANGFTMLDGAEDVHTFTIGDSTYAIVSGHQDDGVQIINISDPTDIVAADAETDGLNSFSGLDGPYGVKTFTIGSSTYAIVASYEDDAVQIIELKCTNSCVSDTSTTTDEGSSTCARLVILGNCGTIAINNDEYRIIHPWSTIPTTEVMVGEPVSITLSTPHNYVAGKINSVSVYTEILGSPANYEESTRIYYTVNGDHYVSDHATEKQLFQIAGATHRIVQDTDVKNLEMFEVVFTMVFAKPMDTSYIVVETKNMHGIPETIYLGNALKVIERPIELLTYEEKSKFKIISEPELKDSLRHDMDIEPDMDMLVVDPEPVVSKVTCGKGTMLKDNICVVDEMSFYFFVNQFMRFFG